MFSLNKILPLLSLSLLGHCLTPAQWRQESIYQVITDRFARTDGSTTASCNINDYCGGTWQGLINKLDYIQGMGFTAVWISPVVKNIEGLTADGSSYHGYWAQDINSLNQHFGVTSDLKALSAALHARGMHLMVDIVTNHMGYIGCGNCVDYTTLHPFNSASYYHPFCFIDYSNAQSITNCWEGSNTVSLPDLRTENSNVASVFNAWITKLVSDYSIDGLRVDSMQQVNSGFWKPFQAAAGGIHAIGEVFNGDPAYTCPYQGQLSGVMNYPTFYTITNAFRSTNGDIQSLVNGINRMKSTCSDVTLLGSFLENHDNPRFPSLTSDVSLIKNAIGFTVLADGIPIVYQGQEQQFSGNGVPQNREALWLSGYNTGSTLYQYIKAINAIRSLAIKKDPNYLTYNAWPIQSDSRTIVMRKGFTNNQIISLWSNRGSNSGTVNWTINAGNAGFGPGWYLTDVIACKLYVADGNGNLAVNIVNGAPVVLFPTQALNGSGICGK